MQIYLNVFHKNSSREGLTVNLDYWASIRTCQPVHMQMMYCCEVDGSCHSHTNAAADNSNVGIDNTLGSFAGVLIGINPNGTEGGMFREN